MAEAEPFECRRVLERFRGDEGDHASPVHVRFAENHTTSLDTIESWRSHLGSYLLKSDITQNTSAAAIPAPGCNG